MSTTDQHANIAIIRAGLAGLTAAYLLGNQVFNVIVVEKNPLHVGEISRTAEHEGFRLDIGGHRFFSKSQEVIDLWNEILLDGLAARLLSAQVLNWLTPVRLPGLKLRRVYRIQGILCRALSGNKSPFWMQ
jgi:monoamine oxidase